MSFAQKTARGIDSIMKRFYSMLKMNRKSVVPIVSVGATHLLCLAIFMQHQNVFMCFDDYGYASLTYGSDGPGSMNYSLKDILKLLGTHYLTWDGRQLCFFVEIICFRYGGIRLIQFVQSIVVIAIFSVLGLFTSSVCSYSKRYCVPFSLLLFGLMNITTVKDGVYWFTASVLYLWPLLPFFAGVYLMETRKKESNWPLLAVLFFIAAYSQEQVAVMVCATVWAFTLFLFVKKEFYKQLLFVDLSATVGAMICILAPGNFARKNGSNYGEWYSIPFIKRFIVNFGKIVKVNIGPYNWVLCLFLTLFLGGVIYFAIPKRRILIVNIFFFVALLYDRVVGLSVVPGTLLRTMWLLYFIGTILFLIIRDQQYLLASVVIGGICSQGMLLVSPAIPMRCHTMFEIVLLLLLELSAFRLYSYISQNGSALLRNFLVAAVLAMGIYAICNYVYIYNGYHKNIGIHWMNHNTLVEYSERIKDNDQAVDENEGIILYKLDNLLFANFMPYQDGYDYIEYWMRNYYEIPQSIPIYWEESH